jgi:predicted glycosyltransferase
MRPRIALYSHDAQGLGHVRRNLAIAETLAEDNDVLLIAGAKEAGVFATPPGVELVTLPALSKIGGTYRSRSLSLGLGDLLHLRAQTMCAVLDAFAPDAFIVDKHPLGIEGELLPALEMLAERGRTRTVLGLREILDDPATVLQEWAACGADGAMREFYDAIWVYGDHRVYDLVVEYGLDADLAAKVSHTGYLGRPAGHGTGAAGALLPDGDLAACLVGGGEDGWALAQAFAGARMPRATTGVILAGPFMPDPQREALHATAAARADVAVLDFVDDPGPLLRRARCAVTMGGYNTICELLHQGCRTLVVPRVRPRREQLIRARRLAATGVLDTVAPALATSARIGDWLQARPGPRPHPADVVDLDGLRRLPGLLAELGVGGAVRREASLAV